MLKKIMYLLKKPVVAFRMNHEILWSSIYRDTITDSIWLKDKAVSPGRWAVGYPFLYVLYRCLNDLKPKTILELGLGQSTRLTCQYAQYYHIPHLVCEHDKDWVDFFKINLHLSEYTTIELLPLKEEKYQQYSYTCYENFATKVSQNKYDLILIDGPFEHGCTYARRDILKVLPAVLAPDFAIMLDDYGSKAEQYTAADIKAILRDHKIEFTEAVYVGAKKLCLITSKSWHFLCNV